MLTYCHLSGSITILLERSILITIVLVTITQLVHQGMTEHAFSLTVDEDDTLAFVGLVFLKDATEIIQLIVEDVRIAHACCGLEQFFCMKVDNQQVIVGTLGCLGL